MVMPVLKILMVMVYKTKMTCVLLTQGYREQTSLCTRLLLLTRRAANKISLYGKSANR